MEINPQKVLDFFHRDNPTGGHLNKIQRAALITMDLLGIEHSTICDLTGCKAETVDRWVESYETTGTVDDEERSPRGRVTTRSQDQRIVGLARQKHFITPHLIGSKLKLHVDDRTVRRRLNEMGLLGRVARSEFPFTPKHMADRLSFAQAHLGWTDNDWKQVVFADETFLGLGNEGQVWVQRPAGKAYDKEYMKHQKRNFAERVGFYSFFSYHGVGPAHVYAWNMNEYLYRAALDDLLNPYFKQNRTRGLKYYLHDNAKYHASHFTQNWFADKPIECIKLPARSPDLNPTENLWSELKRRIAEYQPTTIEEIIEIAWQEWPQIEQSLCAKLVKSMPERMQAVIAAEGHMTRY